MDGALRGPACSSGSVEPTFSGETLIFSSTGSEERSESDRRRPHFRMLRSLQPDWFVGDGEICKHTAPTLDI